MQLKTFTKIQNDFANHIRDPQAHLPVGGIEDRRLQIYRELFFNNVKGFLSSGFPVLESVMSGDEWNALARQFFSSHSCRSPYFVDISKEFVEFLANEYEIDGKAPAFIAELAHYEWLELDVSTRPVTIENPSWDGDTLPEAIAVSELASLVSYQYPVHQIGPDFQPDTAEEPVYLVVYRDTEDDVNFTLLNPATAHLVNLVQTHEEILVAEVLLNLQQAMPQIPEQQLRSGCLDSIKQLLRQQILVPVAD